MYFWDNARGLISVGLPGVVAFVLSLVGVFVLRRAEGWWSVVVAGAVLVGLMLLVPVPRAWVMPRVVMEHLVVPAFVAMAGAVVAVWGAPWVRGRLLGWVGVGVLGVAAWNMAGSGVGRGEFWRVWFGVVGVAWVLRGGGARVVGRGVLVGATLLLGLLLGGAALVWSGAALVLFGAWLGGVLLRPGAVAGVVVLAAGVVAVDLGTGGLVRGRVGFLDFVCVAAMVAPGAAGGVERLMVRWGGRSAAGRSVGRGAGRGGGRGGGRGAVRVGTPVAGRLGVVGRSAGVVVVGVGLAWGVSRFIRV